MFLLRGQNQNDFALCNMTLQNTAFKTGVTANVELGLLSASSFSL